MGRITEILSVGQSRANELKLPYEGALMPDEAYEILKTAPGAKLVDVRSRAELDFVGRIPGAVEIEWMSYPGMKTNPNFMAALQQQVDREALVLFICRNGARSHMAAQAAVLAGFPDCYNVLTGFEGDANAEKHRNVLNGWKVLGLPWEQS
ncbi:MAG: rhodanese-like domain-containing protein [Gallionellaceae bacterium]|jgi:rhodanese-related sulfurtransferase